MRIRHLDYSSLIIEISKDEFHAVTGHKIGDQYGNGGMAYNEDLIGKSFDLLKLRDNAWKLKIASEVRTKIAADLREQANKIEKVLWPIEPVDPIKLEPE